MRRPACALIAGLAIIAVPVVARSDRIRQGDGVPRKAAAKAEAPRHDTTPLDPALFTEFEWRAIGPLETDAGSTPHPRYAHLRQIAIDAAFPWRVCATADAGGAMCIASRGDRGRITARDWAPIGPAGTGFVAPDPANADVVFVTAGASVGRIDRATGQMQDVSPPGSDNLAAVERAPLAFSPAERRALFYGRETLWKSTNGGQSWTRVGPDPAGAPVASIAPSNIDSRTIWIATSDGRLLATRDAGATWTDVTPPAASDNALSNTAASDSAVPKVAASDSAVPKVAASDSAVPKVAASDSAALSLTPSQFDANGAYLASPRGLFRTRDGGAAWTDITPGLPAGARTFVVVEDGQRRGLLFAGTTAGVWLSFDDGDSWQSLALDMPAVAVRDLALHGETLVAATGGRGLWMLDDVMPLRQLTPDVARAELFLFRPAIAHRFRGGSLDGPDAPGAPNPADGVTMSYLVGAATDVPETTTPSPLTIEIIDTATGETIRRLSSHDPTDPLSATPGLHRHVWDVRYAPPPVPGAAGLRGLFAPPGTYQVRLTANGRTLRQAVTVRLDPRVKVAAAELSAQHRLAREVDEMLRRVATARESASSRGDAAAVARLDGALAPLVQVYRSLAQADAGPTEAQQAAAKSALQRATAAMK